MANIFDTRVTLYKGTEYDPDGNPVEFSFCTADFPETDSYDAGEYLFDVDRNDQLVPYQPVGNAAKNNIDTIKEYPCYCDMIISERM